MQAAAIADAQVVDMLFSQPFPAQPPRLQRCDTVGTNTVDCVLDTDNSTLVLRATDSAGFRVVSIALLTY
jgi:hypothetical protein